jgi:hypothetical protein
MLLHYSLLTDNSKMEDAHGLILRLEDRIIQVSFNRFIFFGESTASAEKRKHEKDRYKKVPHDNPCYVKECSFIILPPICLYKRVMFRQRGISRGIMDTLVWWDVWYCAAQKDIIAE